MPTAKRPPRICARCKSDYDDKTLAGGFCSPFCQQLADYAARTKRCAQCGDRFLPSHKSGQVTCGVAFCLNDPLLRDDGQPLPDPDRDDSRDGWGSTAISTGGANAR